MEAFGRRLLWVAVLIGAGVLVAGAALAEVSVRGEVDKTKTKDVTETITIVKTVDIDVDVEVELDSAAESQVVKNQDNVDIQLHDVDIGNEDPAFQPDSEARIDNAVGNGSGIVYINQSPGNVNNQANEASMAAAGSSASFAHSEVAVEQNNTQNQVDEGYQDKYDIITFSALTDTEGIMGINQAANDLNNQDNAISVALASDAVVALGEIDLGQANTENSSTFEGTYRVDEVSGRPSGTSPKAGVFQFNQASGPENNQFNGVNVAIGLTALPE